MRQPINNERSKLLTEDQKASIAQGDDDFNRKDPSGEDPREEIERLNGELRRQITEYDMLMASTGVCIIKTELADGLPVLWCNEATYRAVGYTREEYEAQFGYDLQGYFRNREAPFIQLSKAL